MKHNNFLHLTSTPALRRWCRFPPPPKQWKNNSGSSIAACCAALLEAGAVALLPLSCPAFSRCCGTWPGLCWECAAGPRRTRRWRLATPGGGRQRGIPNKGQDCFAMVCASFNVEPTQYCYLINLATQNGRGLIFWVCYRKPPRRVLFFEGLILVFFLSNPDLKKSSVSGSQIANCFLSALCAVC